MDSQLCFASRDDLWRLQSEMKAVSMTQAEHSERLARLERRQDEDARLKSVWGTSSPFPGILSGTPQQDSIFNPAAEAFKNFDQDQSANLLGSLHLETEEEPRRGASRANSVRFDESALHGHFAQGSRSSSDFFPLRTGSGFGGHPMTERSSSHKSEGRQSSVGLSNPSARLNSLGYDVRQPALANSTPVGPPPGLFHMGPLPSIIRCWLDTNFSNDSLLYAAICTGSSKSLLSVNLACQLGLQDQFTVQNGEQNGERRAKIQVYLPEATIQQSSVRSSSPTPQLPVLTVDFIICDTPSESDSMQIFIGSDVLRLRNADILFSQDRLFLLDDSLNKLAVPLVRPENTAIYQDLCTVQNSMTAPVSAVDSSLTPAVSDVADTSFNLRGPKLKVETGQMQQDKAGDLRQKQSSNDHFSPYTTSTAPQVSTIGDGRKVAPLQTSTESNPSSRLDSQTKEPVILPNGTASDASVKADSFSSWGSWRRDSSQGTRQEPSFSNVASGSSYQRAGRGKGMKVLKPTRSSVSSRTTSVAQTPSSLEAGAGVSRSAENGGGESQTSSGQVNDFQATARTRGSFTSEARSSLQNLNSKPRSANPIGGASAFGWLNSSQ
ncbi:MAG: hypothetical protein MMC33_008767 [Icmadophila ericetorum]|nr:hypothetical protein [Icmadophila ericetorum]